MLQGLKLLALDTIRGFLGFVIAFGAILYSRYGNEALSHLDALWWMVGIGTGVLFLVYVVRYIRYWNYIVMPYSLKLISQPKAESNLTTVYLDRFVRYDKALKTLYYKNQNAIDVEQYNDKKEQILHFLNLYHDMSVELEIEPYKRKWVKLRIFTLAMSETFFFSDLEEGSIFYGYGIRGRYYTPLNDLTHSICVGESGSGKSNLMNLQIYSLLYNARFIEHLYFIDLKGVELSRYNLPIATFVDSVAGVETLLEELKALMYQRFSQMKENGDILFTGKPIICIIDEVGTIGTSPDKKVRENIFNAMIEIFQKGRAAKILLLLYAQKIDSTNIPSNVLANIQTKILMKTDIDFNINNTIGLKEDIERITRFKVADFPKGRAIIKDGLTSDKTMIQVPYLPKTLQDTMIAYFSKTLR